jgi:hypothetical protein
MAHPKITPAVEEFLVDPQNLILATLRTDGRPQLSPVWFVWRDNTFWISTALPLILPMVRVLAPTEGAPIDWQLNEPKLADVSSSSTACTIGSNSEQSRFKTRS